MLVVVAMALLSFVWTPHPIDAVSVADRLQGPSAAHWLGTDQFGRDLLSRIMVGARNSIAVGVVAVGIGLVAGVGLGTWAAARGGEPGCSERLQRNGRCVTGLRHKLPRRLRCHP